MTAIIPINDDYRIELDKNSWQVSRWINRPSRTDGGSWDGLSWHNTILEAGMACQRQLVAEDDLEGVQEVIEALQASSMLIAAAIASSDHPDSWMDAVTGLGV
ncbi:MAG: hypothetical protein RPU32_12540 [Candidatus Sedimenticola sp. (ex Thyasira tokunagai)]